MGDAARGVFAVADGFGGPEAGSNASKTAAEGVREFLIKEAGDLEATLPFVLRTYFSLAGNVLFNALVHANRKVLSLNRDKGIHEKGGASVIAGFLDGDLLALASVGGCEAWLLREERAVQLVTPRAYSRLADPFGTEKLTTPRFPLMALGISEDLEPEVWEFRIRPGDWLILSTGSMGAFAQGELLARKKELKDSAKIRSEFPAWLQDQLQAEDGTANMASSLIVF